MSRRDKAAGPVKALTKEQTKHLNGLLGQGVGFDEALRDARAWEPPSSTREPVATRPIAESIKVIRQLASLHLPRPEGATASPAKATDLDALEAELGTSLPPAFRELYGLQDGGDSRVFFGFEWMSIREIHEFCIASEAFRDPDADDIISHVPGAIREEYFHRLWVPFAHDYGGNYLAMDLGPGPEGVHGQIINMGRDEHRMFVLAPGLAAFLSYVMEQFKNHNIGPEGNLRGSTHFFDGLRERYGHGAASAPDPGFDRWWREQPAAFVSALEAELGTTPRSFPDLTAARKLSVRLDDLAPLEHCHHLGSLVLSGSAATSLRPLSGLKKLKSLVLGRVGVSDIEPLESLPALKHLSLYGTSVEDLRPLTKIEALRSLSVERVPATDLSPLAEMSRLKELNVSATQADDYAMLGELITLKTLDIGDTPIRDIGFMSGLRQLEELRIYDVDVADLASVLSLPNLQRMTCDFETFVKVSGRSKRKIHFTIRGRMSDEQSEHYRRYASSVRR